MLKKMMNVMRFSLSEFMRNLLKIAMIFNLMKFIAFDNNIELSIIDAKSKTVIKFRDE